MSRSSIAIVLLISLALAGAAFAQVGEQKEGADFAMTGVVKAVDAAKNTITIQGANGEGGTLEVDPKSPMHNDDQSIKLGDVKAGWSVAVNGDIRGGKKVVTYLEVVDTP